MHGIQPRDDNDNAFNALENNGVNVALLNRMINYKISHFKDYTNFIVDYDSEETIEDPILNRTTQEQDAYLKSMFEQLGQEDIADDFNENYIKRSAIIVKPLQSFTDWFSSLYPEDLHDLKETRTYLIGDNIDDIDS